MNKFTLLLLGFCLCSTPSVHAMGKRAKQAANSAVQGANDLGNNDAAQQAAGDLGSGIAKGGKQLVDRAYDLGINHGVSQDKVSKMAGTGAKVFGYGKAIEYAGKGAPHVGWVATSAGRAAEGDYSGAAIEGVNGAARTTAVGAVGTAAGIWAAGKVGAVAGSWGGPLGAAAGFVVGCGAAWVGGKIWDKTIGKGKDALDQKVHDWKAGNKYAGPKHKDNRPDAGQPKPPQNPGRDVATQTARQNARNAAQRASRPSRPPVSSGGGGRGRCVCPR